MSCFGFVTLFGFSVSILGFRVFVLGLCVLVLFPSAVVLPHDITTHKLSVKTKALLPKSGDFKVANKPNVHVILVKLQRRDLLQ